MSRYKQEWDDLGRNIQDIIDHAVSAQDYQKLNQTIRQVVDRAVDMGSEAVRKAMDDVSALPPNRRLPARSSRSSLFRSRRSLLSFTAAPAEKPPQAS